MRVRVERPRRLLLLAGAAILSSPRPVRSRSGRRRSDEGEREDLLPNLTQAAPDHLSGRTAGTPESPRFFLGFESAAANLGDGPLMVLGSRTVRPSRP